MITETSAVPAGTKNGHVRWTICALLFFATTINYMDRQILGLLAPVLEKEIGWTEIDYGNLVTAFQIAYAIGLLATGRLIDQFGTRRSFSFLVAFWSLAAMAHALTHTVRGFGIARFLLGLGEAGNFPAAIKTVTEWFPKRERALATGIFNSGSNVGAILSPIVVPWLTLQFGWQASFVVLGATGFVWIMAWHVLYAPPREHPRLSPRELAYIENDSSAANERSLPWRSLFHYRQTWAYVVAMALTSPVWWFYLYWLPKFLHGQFHVSISGMGLPLAIIYTLACVGSIGGGWLSFRFLRAGWSTNASRKTAMLACALCVLPIMAVAKVGNIWTATFLIGLAAAAHQGWSANLYSFVSDTFPKQAIASVVGIGSMFGAVAGILFAQTTGFILNATGNYWSLFLGCSLAYVLALACLHVLAPRMTLVTNSSTSG
ncbi:MAG: transporter [Rariglobus sp.]|jgi:ACS family hexuronate transporter-like MFS transporter|nr:transporter [Rariglobus sp.]